MSLYNIIDRTEQAKVREACQKYPASLDFEAATRICLQATINLLLVIVSTGVHLLWTRGSSVSLLQTFLVPC